MLANDLLMELGTEELPSGAVWPLANAFADHWREALSDAQLAHGDISIFATPRRIAVFIQSLQTEQLPQVIIKRGPSHQAGIHSDGMPTPALLGFARSCGVDVRLLKTIETEKGQCWAYESTTPAIKTAALLPEMLKAVVSKLTIKKPMRWGNGLVEFARPVHWAVFLYGNDVIALNILGVNTGRQSFGHRFHHPEAIQLNSPSEYEEKLKQAYVIANFQLRQTHIVEQARHLAEEHGFEVVINDTLLDEVTSIVEWPNALLCQFEKDFLDVPTEALIAAMQVHQKCFALKDNRGQLVPYFITICNIESIHPEQVISGNQKVMHARLSDAAFFYRQDKKHPLSHHQEATSRVIFQARLGTLKDKADRLQKLIQTLVPTPLQTQALRAAELSKCDLMTGMVGEFPELQGTMGFYYAMHDSENESVALALKEQYLPRFSGDDLPSSELGLALSLADRMDTLVGTFAIGQKPSGMKDPYKLRRHALAVVRLMLAFKQSFKLSLLIESSLQTYSEVLKVIDRTIDELPAFILERMQSYYQTMGVSSNIVHAAKACQADDLLDLNERILALQDFIHCKDAEALAAACKRVHNILQPFKDSIQKEALDPNQFESPLEIALWKKIQQVEDHIAPLYQSANYVGILSELASLRDEVDAFFEGVMVMVEDEALRQNRLCLLSHLKDLLQSVADISLLHG